jgi:DNA processing protein
MGCGADICYPRDNIELYERVMESGGIISDYPLGTEPVGWRFPLRNRIISGLVDKIIVVEAKEKSGSLITVEYGLEQGKDIFAVPGRVGDALSSGCNRLIKDGAGIVISPKDIIKDMNIEINCGNTSKISKKNKLVLEKDLETLYSCVDLFPKNIQQLMEETGKDSVEIIQKLVKLQMMNLVEEPAKNYYSRKI